MKLSYEDHQTITVLTLGGELTVDHSDAFRRACQERFACGVRDVVVDLAQVATVDSAGLEALLWLKDQVAEISGQLRLVRPDATIRKVMEITRLSRRFDVYDTVEAAARSLRFKS
jgi:anti-anti-sigma factor